MITIEEFENIGVEATIAKIRQTVGHGLTYVSFDIDSMDPAFAPGTGTPEFAGFTSREVNRLLRGLRSLNLVGADIVEVSPPFDPSGATALAGANVMFELLCLLAEAVCARKTSGRQQTGLAIAGS
jgi:guanidinopropionase